MNIDQIRAMPGTYILPPLCINDVCVFWDGDNPVEWTVARYSHSEKTTPFDRHWTMEARYFAHVCSFFDWQKKRMKRGPDILPLEASS